MSELSREMGLWVWVWAIFVILLCEEASIVHGDIGTAMSYNPPYTRKQTPDQRVCIIEVFACFNTLGSLLQLLGAVETGKISSHLGIYSFQ